MGEFEGAIDLAEVVSLLHQLKVVHHVPGRIRLRVTSGLRRWLAAIDAGSLRRITDAVEGIRSVRVNPAAASVIITYSTDKINPQWWESLIEGRRDKSVALLRALINTHLVPADVVPQERGWNSKRPSFEGSRHKQQ